MSSKKPDVNHVIHDIHNHCINPHTREVFLHGYVDNVEEEPGIDYRVANQVLKNLTFLDRMNTKPIIMHMSSIGGYWNDGMAIYDTIRQVESPVVIVAYAHARSMTSIIQQAGDLRLMMPNSDFLIHHGTWGGDGNYVSMEAEMEWSKHQTKVMLDIYVRRCLSGAFFDGKTPKQIGKYLDDKMRLKQEYYMTPDAAIDMGFADGIVGRDYTLQDILKGNVDVEKVDF